MLKRAEKRWRNTEAGDDEPHHTSPSAQAEVPTVIGESKHMNDLNIGKLITTEQQRDAIHVAIAPVEAAQNLWAGMRVAIVGPEHDAHHDTREVPLVAHSADEERTDDSLDRRDLEEWLAEQREGKTSLAHYELVEVHVWPRYSESWDAMKLVVEEMQKRGYGYLLTETDSGHRACFLPVALESVCADGNELPEAVCRAALLTLEVTP